MATTFTLKRKLFAAFGSNIRTAFTGNKTVNTGNLVSGNTIHTAADASKINMAANQVGHEGKVYNTTITDANGVTTNGFMAKDSSGQMKYLNQGADGTYSWGGNVEGNFTNETKTVQATTGERFKAGAKVAGKGLALTAAAGTAIGMAGIYQGAKDHTDGGY